MRLLLGSTELQESKQRTESRDTEHRSTSLGQALYSPDLEIVVHWFSYLLLLQSADFEFA